MKIVREAVAIICALGAGIPACAQVTLENFSSVRKNGDGSDLWAAYLGEDPAQSYSLENGMFKLVVGSGSAPYVHFLPVTSAGYTFPAGFVQGHIQSGAWNANFNRLRFWVKCSKSVTRRDDGGDILQIGTYVKPTNSSNPSSQGAHYYHLLDPNFYANRWMVIELNRLPQHQVGNSGGINWPEDPEYSRAGVHYYDGMTRFYFDAGDGSAWSGQTCYFDNFELDVRNGEPDTAVSSVSGTYTGSKYEVAWAAPKNTPVSYEVRYSTSSMKANGFNSGTAAGTVSNPGNDYTGTIWTSPAVAEADAMYIAIRPTTGSAFTELKIPRAPGSTTTPPQSNPCDLNKDGSVTVSDLQMNIDSALGKTSCSSDLNGDGVCNVVDTQRIVNAVNGASCRTGS